MSVIQIVFALMRSLVCNRPELVTESLALRQQLSFVREKSKRPSLGQHNLNYWGLHDAEG